MSPRTSARARGPTFPTRSTTGRTATRHPTSPIPRLPRNENRRPRQRGRTYLSPQRSHSLGGRMFNDGHFTTHRRGFLGRVAASAAAFGLGGLVAPFATAAQPTAAPRKTSANPEFEAWLNKITGKHKIVYDVPEPHDGFAFAWSRVVLNTTNETYGTTDAED